ncbi:hypothetical protein N0V82_009032 [Gnomoniopsis sp. IMI 355080]|nr:hypothetical protein N0V82_009032 [Gnomoniopsis sp. IMI 355080]
MADQSPSKATCSPVEAVQEEEEKDAVVRFPPEEEAVSPTTELAIKIGTDDPSILQELLHESNAHKTKANSLYVHGDYHQALDIYAQATDICPNYLDYELALLQTNIAACHLKLHEWKNAIAATTTSLDKLDKLDANIALEVKAVEDATLNKDRDFFADVDHEIVSPGASRAVPGSGIPLQDDPGRPARSQRLSDSRRIRYKALMRRARARSELGGWQNLEGARADYTVLKSMDNLTRDDHRLVAAQLAALPARINEAKEKETAQMWDQLKQLGNGILKPFGLSTDNFQMQQDPKTGGYSMNMKSG